MKKVRIFRAWFSQFSHCSSLSSLKVMKTDKMLSGRFEQVVGKDAGQIEEVLKYHYLAELLENVAAGLKGLAQ